MSLKEESSTVQSLKDEFTQRIADTERKAQLACKERDIAKKVTFSPVICGHNFHKCNCKHDILFFNNRR